MLNIPDGIPPASSAAWCVGSFYVICMYIIAVTLSNAMFNDISKYNFRLFDKAL